MNETQIHLPADEAPEVTGEFARCKNCGCQWAVQADSDKLRCVFCDATENAIIVMKEDV